MSYSQDRVLVSYRTSNQDRADLSNSFLQFASCLSLEVDLFLLPVTSGFLCHLSYSLLLLLVRGEGIEGERTGKGTRENVDTVLCPSHVS